MLNFGGKRCQVMAVREDNFKQDVISEHKGQVPPPPWSLIWPFPPFLVSRARTQTAHPAASHRWLS